VKIVVWVIIFDQLFIQ